MSSSARNDENFVCIQDFEDYAIKTLSKTVADYYKSGANHEQTLKENRNAFLRLRIRPRCLRDVSERKLDTTVLGYPISFPVGISPSAMQRMAHPDGEVAITKAASAAGTVMILSTLSTTSIEDVADAAPKGLRWFQLYVFKDREVTRQLVERAENAGYKALVLTVDTPFFGCRLNDVRNKFSLPSHLRLANFEMDDIKSSGVQTAKNDSGLSEYAVSLFDASITWEDIQWLKSITSLPIVVKGVLTGEDAILAVKHGASAILVSNHGARQLDGVPATIEVLPEIVRAVRNKCEVYLDGGVRTGTDIFKAIALGAKVVFVGRPALWGLTHSGEQGVKRVLEILKKEYDAAMGLAGCSTKEHIKSSMVIHQNFYSKI